MMCKRKCLIQLFFGCLIFIAGVVIGKIIQNIPILEFDRTIDVSDVLNVIVAFATLGVALYIAYILEREKINEEYITNFLNSKIIDIKDDIKNFIVRLTAGPIEIHEINLALKGISRSYIDLKELFELIGLEISSQNDAEILKLLKHIKILATEESAYKFGTNVIEYTDVKEVVIGDMGLVFENLRIEKIRDFGQKFINNIFRLILDSRRP